MAEVIVLGSGTFQPELKRHCSSYLFKVGKENIVFDFGRGAIDNLIRTRINLYNIRNIFISHIHADHLSEIGAFLQWVLYENNMKKIDNYVLTVYGPVGLAKSINYILKAHNMHGHKYSNRIKIKELKNRNGVKFDGFVVKCFSVEHAVDKDKFNSLSYRIELGKKAICYSGDSPDCKGLRKACKDTDLSIIEATLPEKWNVKSHLTGEQLGKIAKEEKIKKLVATHVAPHYLKDVRRDIKRHYKGRLLIAEDLMRIKI